MKGMNIHILNMGDTARVHNLAAFGPCTEFEPCEQMHGPCMCQPCIYKPPHNPVETAGASPTLRIISYGNKYLVSSSIA